MAPRSNQDFPYEHTRPLSKHHVVLFKEISELSGLGTQITFISEQGFLKPWNRIKCRGKVVVSWVAENGGTQGFTKAG